MANHWEMLANLRTKVGARTTTGLGDDVVKRFIASDQKLQQAVEWACTEAEKIEREFPGWLSKSEDTLLRDLQQDFVNFYTEDTVNPYAPIAGSGPWLITSKGAVIHDSGGYGMLGFGHAPKPILNALALPHVMANIMTPAFAQKRFTNRLQREIGFNRQNKNPFSRFICINSGSEAVTVALRLSDINVGSLTKQGGRYEGWKVKFLAIKGGFHGRTDRPAQCSDSSMEKYKKFLGSFRSLENLVTVAPNDVAGLKQAFADAEKNKIYFECFLMEPVMGEGNPGESVTPEFYATARQLTAKSQTFFLVDSIQASLRAHGCLSIVDYPGFEKLDAPDMETYSKALNGGQFPLSVLALRAPVAELYQKGVYGNTMTTNPRSLDVASAALDMVTPELRRNIVERGKEFVKALEGLQREFPNVIEGVKGTGLLCSAAIVPGKFKVVGKGGLEEMMRRKGIGVIHGGENSLRFTPHFAITGAEIALVIDTLRSLIK